MPRSFKAEEITEHIIDKGNCSRTLLVQAGELLLCVSCRQFAAVRLNFKLSTYNQETFGDKYEALFTESFKRENRLEADNGTG